MATKLHTIREGKKNVDRQMLDALPYFDRFGAVFDQKKLADDEFPPGMQNKEAIKDLIKDKLMLDGNAKLNLATFCQTDVDKDVREIMDMCIDKNMIDKDEYPNTAELECRCIKMMAHLWHNPDPENCVGCSTIGSSEACMLGGLAMKKIWSERLYDKIDKEKGTKVNRKQYPLPAKSNMVCGPVQVCWHKFGEYFDVEMRESKLKRGTKPGPDGRVHNEYVLNADMVRELVDENTIGVVVTLGNTMILAYEDVQSISDVLDEIEKEKGWNIPIHVDGASGGFLAPFLNFLPEDVDTYNIQEDGRTLSAYQSFQESGGDVFNDPKTDQKSTPQTSGAPAKKLNKQETLNTVFKRNFETAEENIRCKRNVTREDYESLLAHYPSFCGAIHWDFKLPRVKSINASGHKFGLAPLGAGWVLWREPHDLHDDLQFRVNYLGGDMPTIALNFSRPGGQVVAQYYNFMRYGWAGYARIQRLCSNLAVWFSMELQRMKLYSEKQGKEVQIFEVVFPALRFKGIPGVCWTLNPSLKDEGIYGASEYDLSDRLRIKSWQVPAYTLCENLDDIVVMRILIRHGTSLDLLGYLLKSIQESIEYFKAHPTVHNLTHEEGKAFHH